MNSAPNPTRAVVIGASMAGLLAARVLADHFGEVLVLDKDSLPDGAAHRRGVPQSRHLHILLATGQHIIERHFPGFAQDLMERGAPLAEGGVFMKGGYVLQPEGPAGITASRPLIESVVRRCLRALPNMHIQPDTAVRRLTASPDSTRITGVAAASADGAAAIEANLVVDATGRGSRAAAWLEELGYGAPTEEAIEIPIHYATRIFRRDPADLSGATIEVVTPDRPDYRSGVMMALEGSRWMVTLAGYGDETPPQDLPGFIAFTRSLAAPRLGEVVARAEPLGEPCATHFPGSLRRRWDRLARHPAGFLVIGDGLCSFNPVFGQGMTVAAQESLALAEALRGPPETLARRFYRAAIRITDRPWTIAAGADLQHPAAVGRRPPFAKYVAAYISRVQKAAQRDPAVGATWNAAMQLAVAPSALLRPGIATRVLRDGMRRAGALPWSR